MYHRIAMSAVNLTKLIIPSQIKKNLRLHYGRCALSHSITELCCSCLQYPRLNMNPDRSFAFGHYFMSQEFGTISRQCILIRGKSIAGLISVNECTYLSVSKSNSTTTALPRISPFNHMTVFGGHVYHANPGKLVKRPSLCPQGGAVPHPIHPIFTTSPC